MTKKQAEQQLAAERKREPKLEARVTELRAQLQEAVIALDKCRASILILRERLEQ